MRLMPLTTVVIAILSNAAHGDLVPIITEIDEWYDVVPDPVVIDFVGMEEGTIIDDEFIDFGVTFGGLSFVMDNSGFDNDLFTDDYGLGGLTNTTTLYFTEPATAFAIMHPGRARLEFYLDGELIGLTDHSISIGGSSVFAGTLPDFVFDEVRIIDDTGLVTTDNIYFTFDPIPAPGALALLGMAALAGRSRRR